MVQFLLAGARPDAARAELQARIAAAGDPRPFQRALAGLDFDQGRRDEAIAAAAPARSTGAEPSDGTRDLQVTLAQMLAQMPATTGAATKAPRSSPPCSRAIPNDVGALKLHARMAIDADRPGAGDPGHAAGARPGAATTRRS